jgi:selenocysteine lyase/cysteine desulfurase
MTYLNTAAEGIPPVCAIDALHQYARDKLLGMDGRLKHEQQWQSLRVQAGKALGLSADQIGICSCSSEAFNLAALALQLGEDDEVVINDLDFPAGATPWLQPACPATVKIWRAREGALRVEDLTKLLGSRTKLVTVSLVSFYNGFMMPLRDIVEAVHRHSDALIAVDVTQALGRIPFQISGADLVISSTHKWILGSHGGGLVGVPAERADRWTVPAGGWFNLQNAFDDDRFERTVTKPGAASFSVGMPNYPAVYAVNAALKYIQSVGVQAIDRYAGPLVHSCMDALKQLPVEMLTPDEPDALAGIIAFRHPQAEPIHKFLHQRNIHVMSHAGRLRVAIHGYNTPDDIERLVTALQDALKNA